MAACHFGRLVSKWFSLRYQERLMFFFEIPTLNNCLWVLVDGKILYGPLDIDHDRYPGHSPLELPQADHKRESNSTESKYGKRVRQKAKLNDCPGQFAQQKLKEKANKMKVNCRKTIRERRWSVMDPLDGNYQLLLWLKSNKFRLCRLGELEALTVGVQLGVCLWLTNAVRHW